MNPNPDPTFVYQMLVAAQFLLGIVVSVVTVVGSKRAQKREVTISPEVVTKSDCELKHVAVGEKQGHLEKTMDEVKTDLAALTKSLSDHTGKLHNRVDTLLAGVARIEGRLDERSKHE